MKILLLTIILFSAPLINSYSVKSDYKDSKFGPEDAYNLINGLLRGLVFQDVDALMKCFNNVPDMYSDLLQIISLLKHIDYKHLKELIEALTKIFDLVIKVVEGILPCADVKDSERIQEIIDKIQNANIAQIALNILFHGGQILTDISNLPKDFNSSNFYQFGFDIGDLVTQILLTGSLKFGPTDAYKLIEGLLKGLRFNNTDQLMKCVDDVPDIYSEVEEIIQLIEHIDFRHIDQLIEAISKIFDLVSKILNALSPCADLKDSERLKQIIQLLKKVSIYEIAVNLLIHGGQLLKDFEDLPKEYRAGNFSQFGYDLGDIINELVLTSNAEKLKFGPQDSYLLVQGLLKGLQFTNADALMKCFNNIPDIYNDVLSIVNLIEHLDYKNVTQLIQCLSQIFDLISKILNAVDPCADVKDSQRIQEIIEDIKNANLYKIAVNILLHGGQVLKDITDLPNSFNSGNFGQFGFDIGDLVVQILLS